MQKVEAKRIQTSPQAPQRPSRGDALQSPQGEQIAQLETMAEVSPHVGGVARVAAMANNGPRASAQRRLMEVIGSSSRMATQRQSLEAVHNSHEAGAHGPSINALAGGVAHRENGEGWLQTQAAQGAAVAVKPDNTGLPVNDDAGLEREADVMGERALATASSPASRNSVASGEALGSHFVGSLTPSSTAAQLKPALAKVTWGVTHAVKEVNGSIYGDGGYEEGEIGPWGELTSGEVVVVDDDDIFISRRGSNQENSKTREEHGKREPQVEWIRALKIKGIDVRGLNVFIRSETIHCGDDVKDPEAGWQKIDVNPEVSWDDEGMVDGVKRIGEEYAKAVELGGGKKEAPRNICSTEEMTQDDEGLDVATEFQVEAYRDLSGYGPKAKTMVAQDVEGQLIGVMQITVGEESTEKYLYVKWLLGSRSSRGAGVALVRKALEYAIENAILKVKVESAMSAVEWYRKRGFFGIGKAQHMNDTNDDLEDDDKSVRGLARQEMKHPIDCGCVEMELQFYWSKD